MTKYSIAFEWQRDRKGYRFDSGERDERRIVRNGGPLEKYNPLEISGMLKIFSNATTDEKLLAFVNAYGPLTKAGNQVERRKGSRVRVRDGKRMEMTDIHIGDDVKELRKHVVWFKAVLGDGRSKGEIPKTLSIRPKPLKIAQTRLMVTRGLLRIEFSPDALLDALRLQLALLLTEDHKRAECRYCHQPFPIGVGTGKRSDAEFCSDQHRILFNSRKRTIR